MVRIEIRIEGITALIMNRFHDAAQIASTSQTSVAATGGSRGTPQEQAERKLYTGADGKLVIPTPNVISCFTVAGKYFKAGKSKITTQKSSLIPAALQIEGVDVPLNHTQPWRVDARPVRIPSTGGRIICYRPIFDDWALRFDAMLDSEFFAPQLLREIVDTAGRRVGLGDFRPDTKGPFGQFKVTLWKVIDLSKPKSKSAA